MEDIVSSGLRYDAFVLTCASWTIRLTFSTGHQWRCRRRRLVSIVVGVGLSNKECEMGLYIAVVTPNQTKLRLSIPRPLRCSSFARDTFASVVYGP